MFKLKLYDFNFLGKTPLDKARERNDEGHREVASILQSPADWIAASANSEDTAAAADTASEEQPTAATTEGKFFFTSRM